MGSNTSNILDVWTVWSANEDCKLKHFKRLTYGELYHGSLTDHVFAFVTLEPLIIDQSDDLEELIERSVLHIL